MLKKLHNWYSAASLNAEFSLFTRSSFEQPDPPCLSLQSITDNDSDLPIMSSSLFQIHFLEYGDFLSLMCYLYSWEITSSHELVKDCLGTQSKTTSRIFSAKGAPSTPHLNEKTDSGKSHLQDLAQCWRPSKGVDIPKISQFYWTLFEKTRFLCFCIIKLSKKRAKIEPKYS